MKENLLSGFFRRSQAVGMICELVNFGFMLLCGFRLSELLELALAGRWEPMYRAGVYTGLALLTAIVPKYGLSVCRSRLKLRDTQSLREYLYQSILDRRVPMDDRGEMAVRMNSDVREIADYFQQTIPGAVSGSVVMICSTLLLCRVDWRIGLIFFTLNLTQLIPVVTYEKWARQIYNQTHSDEEAYCNWMLEGYGGIRTIKAYGVEEWFMRRFYALKNAIIMSGKRAERVGTVENIIFGAIDSLLTYGSYVIIGLFVLVGGLDIKDTPLLIILAGYLFSSISTVFELRLQQFDYQEAVKRLRIKGMNGGGIGEQNDAEKGGSNGEETEGQNILEGRNISKTYGEKQILCRASCAIGVGERVLLAGENGSGKSTLLRILVGLEDVDGGEVIGKVSEENIALSLQEEPDLNVSGQELVCAMAENGRVDMEALAGHLKEFRMEELLFRRLSELSPGERKKFYLSAALAHHGELLILDEPTNHIDQESVYYLKKQLEERKGTCIVCTHAPDLILKWNKTIFVQDGCCHMAGEEVKDG